MGFVLPFRPCARYNPGVDAAAAFAELVELDPELGRIEAEARAVRDPGGELFCANHAWFDIKDGLRRRIGVWRRPRAGEDPEAARRLGSAEAFETAFQALYPLLPPCRGCGCQIFEPHREADAALRAEVRSAPQRDARRGAG